jgi:hypothetical protein
MPYSVLQPESDSPNWTILDDRGEAVFSGHQEQCEEWLDLAEFSGAAGEWPPERITDVVLTRLQILELATALLRRW